MSRTIRRKNTDWNYRWALSELIKVPGTWQWVWVPIYNRRERKRKLALYHAESGCGSWGTATPPRWYRKMLNRKYSRREEQTLRKALRKDLEEVVLIPRKRNASWYW